MRFPMRRRSSPDAPSPAVPAPSEEAAAKPNNRRRSWPLLMVGGRFRDPEPDPTIREAWIASWNGDAERQRQGYRPLAALVGASVADVYGWLGGGRGHLTANQAKRLTAAVGWLYRRGELPTDIDKALAEAGLTLQPEPRYSSDDPAVLARFGIDTDDWRASGARF